MHEIGRFKKAYVKTMLKRHMSWEIERKDKEKKKGIRRTYFCVVIQLYTLPSCPEELLNERGDNTKLWKSMNTWRQCLTKH